MSRNDAGATQDAVTIERLVAPIPPPVAAEDEARLPQLLVRFADDATILEVSEDVWAYGGGPDHYLGRSGNDIVHPEDLTILGGAMESVVGSGSHRVVTVRLLAPDGRWRRFEAVGIEVEGDGPEQVWTLTFRPYELVSPDTPTEAEQFRSLASLAPIGIFSMAPDGRLLYANPYWVRLHDLDDVASPDAMCASVDPEDLDRLLAGWRAAMDARERYEFEYRVQTRAGTRRLRGQVAPRLSFRGKLNGWLGSVEDVTELMAAIEQADEANRAKSRFLSRMSHELRTPLNAILGFSQLLQLDTVDPADVHEAADVIHRSGRHLLALIDEVLDISRIESGELRLRNEPVDVVSVVAEAVETLSLAAGEREVAIDVERPGDDVVVLADRRRLLQVLINLVSNAVKYNRRGGRVTVTIGSGDGTGTVAVADTGAGIPAADLPRLFVPFDRMGAEATEVEGTGIGLPIANALVEQMGGTLGVESTVGVGTRFTASLPVAADAPAPRLEQSPAVAVTPTPAGTVLCVEDDAVNARLMAHIVKRRPNVRLVITPRGETALDLAAAERPDLILLDLGLPDMGGDRLLERLQDDDGMAQVPVVVVTADATPGLADELVARGATEVLTKPIDITRVLSVIDDALT